MSVVVTIENRGRIPFLNKNGPIGTPIEITDDLYNKLHTAGVRMNVIDVSEKLVKSIPMKENPFHTETDACKSSIEPKIEKEKNDIDGSVISEPPANMSNRQKKKWKAEQRRIATATAVEKANAIETSKEITTNITPSNMEEFKTKDMEETTKEDKEIISE